MKFAKVLSSLACISLMISLVGCKTQDTKVQEQVLNVSWPSEPVSLDLIKYGGANDLKVIWNIYEPLVRISEGKITSAGAKSWKISDDGLEYAFELQENYWSDGEKVKASDYVSLLKRMADPDSLFSYASDYYAIKNFEKVNLGELETDSLGVKAVDDKTLVISLEYPDGNFLSSVEIYPERSDIVEKYGEKYGYSPETMVCCGPYQLKEWSHNSTLKLEKNVQYWDNNSVKLNTINMNIIPDEATEYMEFKAGNIDSLSVSDEKYLAEFRNDDSVYEVNAQSARTYMFIFNTKDGIMQNEKVRQAFSMSITREKICSSLDNSLTTPAYGLIPPSTMVGTNNYREKVAEPLTEIKDSGIEAKSVLKDGLSELGYSSPDQVTITLSCPSDSASQTMAEYYKQMWENALGVNININLQEFATYRSLIWSDEYQIATTAWGGSLEPKFLLSRWLPDNQCQWDNDEYADLVNTAAKISNDDDRLVAYAKAEKMLVADKAVIAPIKYDGYSIFYYNRVKGTSQYPFDNMGFKNMYIEQ